MLRFSPYDNLKLLATSMTLLPNFRLIPSAGISIEYPLYASEAITPTKFEASAGLISKVSLAGISLYLVTLSTAVESATSFPVTVNSKCRCVQIWIYNFSINNNIKIRCNSTASISKGILF